MGKDKEQEGRRRKWRKNNLFDSSTETRRNPPVNV